MCGRYASSADPDELVELFEVDEVADDLPVASYNVAPTDPVPAVLERLAKDRADSSVSGGSATRKLRPLRWGLVPSWAKDRSIGARMINARVESVAEKPAFRKAFAARRCLLPADGYFEWYVLDGEGVTTSSGRKTRKQPFFIHRGDGGPLVMAGIYEYWKDPAPAAGADPWVLSCSVITTTATDAVGHIHDRMPMVIGRDAWAAWLDPTMTDSDAALELLQVTEATQLEAYAVSTEVNSVRNNGPDLVRPIPTEPDLLL